jgi:hypothetical protein
MLNTVILFLIAFLLFLIFIVLLGGKKVELKFPSDIREQVFKVCAGAINGIDSISCKLTNLHSDGIITQDKVSAISTLLDIRLIELRDIMEDEIQKLAMSNLRGNSDIFKELTEIKTLLAKNLRDSDQTGEHSFGSRQTGKIVLDLQKKKWRLEKR